MSLKSVVVLQARTNSARLPGKVLLPINGLPLVVLAAKRAANKGKEVIVATSRESTDDALAALVQQYGIRCYRGSLNNVLERIVAALDEYDDTTLVFRLTADNVFPDGSLIDEMERDFIQRNLDYLCCNGEPSGLPYGLSVELTRLRHLRTAVESTQSLFDREHVTPYIRRIFGDVHYQKYRSLGKGNFRCTIDCLDDYLSIQSVFSKIRDAVEISALELVTHLDGAIYQPTYSNMAAKLVFGSAQLGMDYGIANKSGKPDWSTASCLIKTAITNGVSYIDTARAYGNSEEVIGNVLKSGWGARVKVVTKLSPLQDCPRDATPAVVKAFVDASVYQSCSALHMSSLDVLILHRASCVHDWDGVAWSRLLEHKANGVLNVLGISVQSPAELALALDLPDVGLIQMPFNVFDWRWDSLIPKIEEKKQKHGLIIHVRGALLQGLLPSTCAEHWYRANVQNYKLFTSWLALQSRNTASNSVADFCLRAVKTLDWVDGVVVGMESLDQLAANITTFCSPNLPEAAIKTLTDSYPRLEEKSLNPTFWR